MSHAQQYEEKPCYPVVREYCGHGLAEMHESHRCAFWATRQRAFTQGRHDLSPSSRRFNQGKQRLKPKKTLNGCQTEAVRPNGAHHCGDANGYESADAAMKS